MPEFLAIILTWLLIVVVAWVVLSLIAGAFEGDIFEGMVTASGVIVGLHFVGGVIVGAIWVIKLIWSTV